MYRPGIGEVELPNEIERALEEHRLVFFCGAGVSVYSGLPLFKGLVEHTFRETYRPICELSGDDLEPAKASFCAGQYDRALGLLEQVLTPGTMRRAVIAELSKAYDGELLLHKAILDLARVPGGGYHLVTTNFDARFESAGLDEQWVHDAPRLAPPRPRDWRHTTYLHGRIKTDDPDGRHLVLTSADFGRAYLQDGWAARFVVELFREFTVLFIGYSVEDPVMSYLVDALAAHRRYSQQFRTAFALVGFDERTTSDRDARVRDWRAKSIEPITFPKACPDDYSAMSEALIAWAEDRRLGLQSRINTALRATTQAYLQRDKEAEQVVWALSRHDGSVARAFASAEPPADPSWLRAFEEIDVPQEDGQRFKLISFPSLPTDDRSPSGGGIPLAGRAAGHYGSGNLSQLTHHIGVWVSRHLDHEDVVQWVAQQRGVLHPEFAGVIAWRMGQPDCQISEMNRRFWSIVLMLGGNTDRSIFDLWRISKVSPAGIGVRRHAIVEALRPMLRIAPPYGSWFNQHGLVPRRMRDLAHIEITLNDHDGMIVREKSLTEDDLAELADEFTTVLGEALQFGKLADLALASGHSHWELRSIADHPAPGEHPDRWSILATLARDAFMALQKHDRRAARALLQRWITLARRPGFGLFLRLALFAATQAEELPLDDLVGALLENDAAALWSGEFEAELAAFLRKQGPVLEENGLLAEILVVIRKGPPEAPTMSHDPELRRSKIAVRLMWLQESGVALPAELAEMARTWEEEQREHEAATDVWPSLGDRVGSSGDPVEIAALLSEDGDARPDAWSVYSVGDHVTAWLGEHPDQAIAFFQALAERGDRGEALASRVVAWLSDRAEHSKVLSCLSTLAGSSKTEFNEYLISSVARALRVLAESVSELDEGDEFWPIWSFVVNTAASSSKTVQPHENPLTDSLNAPGGYLAEALIFKLQHEKSNEVPGEHLRERLNALAAGDRDFHFLARTMLASRLPWLHAIDREWAVDVLIARMGRNGSESTSEARALWQGYLWAPGLNPKLLEDLKPVFLQALTCDFGLRDEDNLYRLFADLLLKAPDKLSGSEKHSVFRDMPINGLVTCAHYWRQVLQGAPKGAGNLWREKIRQIISAYWPVVYTKVIPETVEALALLALQTREAFPDAFAALSGKSLLMPLARSGLILHGLVDPRSDPDTSVHYDYVGNHPYEILELIDRSIDFSTVSFEKDRLRAILDRARGANDSVEHTDSYRRLYQWRLS